VIKNCNARAYSAFGPYKIKSVEDLDGWKFVFGDEKWVMIRASGTEPVLRVYAQGPNAEECRKMLDATKGVIL